MNSGMRVRSDYGQIYTLQPDSPMSEPAPVGEVVVLRTLDSSGGQINVHVSYEDLDPSKFFPVVGPIAIEGVKAGDLVGIEILEIQTDPIAHTWTRPGLGLLDMEKFVVMEVDSETLEIRPGGSDKPSIGAARAKAHVGALGLLPHTSEQARTLGHYGGNIDFSSIGAGSTVWLTASVDGGGFFIGDVHASIGDGEVCGTGAETGAEISLRFSRLPNRNVGLPTVRDVDGRLWVIGVGANVEDALREATEYCVARLAESNGVSVEEAYLAVGLLLKVQVCQVVNPRTSVAVTLESGVDRIFEIGHSE